MELPAELLLSRVRASPPKHVGRFSQAFDYQRAPLGWLEFYHELAITTAPCIAWITCSMASLCDGHFQRKTPLGLDRSSYVAATAHHFPTGV